MDIFTKLGIFKKSSEKSEKVGKVWEIVMDHDVFKWYGSDKVVATVDKLDTLCISRKVNMGYDGRVIIDAECRYEDQRVAYSLMHKLFVSGLRNHLYMHISLYCKDELGNEMQYELT